MSENKNDGWPERFTISRPLAVLERLIGRIASREIPNTGATVMLDEALDEERMTDYWRGILDEPTR